MSSYIEKLFSLDGKVAIVTGGSKGIGSEISLALLKHTPYPVYTYRDIQIFLEYHRVQHRP